MASIQPTIPLTPALKCTIGSFTIQPGQTFIPPPNTTVIGGTNISSLESDCIDLTKIETVQCYAVLIAGLADNNSKVEYFETNQQKVVGLELNGEFISFGTGEVLNDAGLGKYNMNIIWERINQYVPGCLFGGVSYDTGGTNNSARSVLSIKTIPSIGKNLLLVVHAIANMNPGGGVSDVPFYARFISHTELDAQGYKGLPVCSLS